MESVHQIKAYARELNLTSLAVNFSSIVYHHFN